MAWTDVNFSEVNPGAELIPEGEYTFMVTGANRDKIDPEAFSVRLSMATAGAYAGQTVYMRYPNPDKAGKGVPGNDPRNWVVKSFKIFELATGKSLQENEHPVQFVNRIAKEADQAKKPIYIDAKVVHETFADKETGEPVTRHKVAFRSVRPAEAVAAE